jgi:uncharacterized protein YndB with AHSA1/START domain
LRVRAGYTDKKIYRRSCGLSPTDSIFCPSTETPTEEHVMSTQDSETTPSKATPDRSRRFEMRIDIAAPRDAVWEAIASDVELRRWFAPQARVEPGVGGRVEWTWKDHYHWPQRIEVWEPGRRLRTRYDSTVPDGHGGREPLFVDFRLEGEGGTTTLRLVHSGFGPEAAFDHEYDGISRGWQAELRSLRLYLEKHAGRDRVLAWSQATLPVDADEAWRRVTGSAGLACGTRLDGLREGDAFRIETADGDVFEGRTLTRNRHEFAGVAQDHGDGLFRVWVEGGERGAQVWLWLATYDAGAAERAAALQARWDSMLATLAADVPAGA